MQDSSPLTRPAGASIGETEHAIKLNIHFEQDQPLDLSAFEAAGPSANADRPTAPPVPQPELSPHLPRYKALYLRLGCLRLMYLEGRWH